MFVENIEEAIDCLERHGLVEARASPDRKVMQRFEHFMRIAADTTATEEMARLKKARSALPPIKRLRDALAHGSVSCWSEDGPVPQIMAFNQERGGKIRYTSDPDEVQQFCKVLSQAAIDLHLVSRRIAYKF